MKLLVKLRNMKLTKVCDSCKKYNSSATLHISLGMQFLFGREIRAFCFTNIAGSETVRNNSPCYPREQTGVCYWSPTYFCKGFVSMIP